MHRFMCVATVYVIRAIQRDIGIDLNDLVTPKDLQNNSKDDGATPQHRFFGSIRVQFFHRLWAVIGAPNSPLADYGGPEGSFRSAHDYLIGKNFSGVPTSENYQLASKLFGIAREWIKATAALGSPEDSLGPVDPFDKLDYLAKNNDIVCRLLAARPDKRPQQMVNPDRGKLPTISASLPVQLDFSYLPSRVYPLLKLR